MKKVLLPVIALFFSASLMAQTKADSMIKVNVEKHDFGKIKQGVPVTYSFEIKNITNKPVVVSNTWASCGCTTPEKITEPIAPGATAKLKVQYNAAAVAPFNKDVYIQLAGVETPKTVHITGEVLSADAYDTWVKTNGKSKDSKTNN
ncbi:MAG: DUF1573 domain-containing protein [Bacteroidetes bacterium]|nr:DUF1573 domain-containing protein [Bacteroidota bacterium]MBS1929576.1 DUF1573 domain-containing protein [Bacteroidota bacterium]